MHAHRLNGRRGRAESDKEGQINSWWPIMSATEELWLAALVQFCSHILMSLMRSVLGHFECFEKGLF